MLGRPDALIGIHGNEVDLINSGTGKIDDRITVGAGDGWEASDLALLPGRRCLVTARRQAGRGDVTMPSVFLVDEAKGTSAAMPGMHGDLIAVDATGNRVATFFMAVWHDSLGSWVDSFGSSVQLHGWAQAILFATYAADGGGFKAKQIDMRPDLTASALRMAPDGKEIALLMNAGEEQGGHVTAKIYDPADLKRSSYAYRLGERIRDLAYQPSGPLVAATDGSTVAMFKRGVADPTGQTPLGGLRPMRIARVAFSPDGKALLVFDREESTHWTMRWVPLPDR